jgi:nucleoside-diphosphate-sugar epimerase
MHIVITGAAGAVGQCVTEALHAGHTLTLLDGGPAPAVGGPRHPEKHTRLNNHYAVSKVYGELLGRMHARRHGMSVVCLRLGWFPRPRERHAFARKAPIYALGWTDAGRLFRAAVEADGVSFTIVNGLSSDAGELFDLEIGRQTIGYDSSQTCEEAWREHAARLGVALDGEKPCAS